MTGESGSAVASAEASARPAVRVDGLVKRFDGSELAAVAGVSLDIPSGAFFTLLGPSGCGKSTTLRCIAGLERPDVGEIRFGPRVVFSDRERINVPTYRRRIGMVFQSYAIWPHMTVLQNVEYPLQTVPRSQRRSRSEIRDQAMAALEMVGMGHLAKRSAPLLSGGEQQRVALARALVQEPDVLLLDEPLSNLDAKLRDQMRHELRDLHAKIQITTIYVTHDQEEAFALSDQIAVLSRGEVMEVGSPAEIYRVSRTPFGAEFVGAATRLSGRVIDAAADDAVRVATPLGELRCRTREPLAASEDVWVYIRPEEVIPAVPSAAAPAGFDSSVRARITRVTFLGGMTEWLAEANGVTIRGRSVSFSEASQAVRDNLNAEIELLISSVRCLPVSSGNREPGPSATGQA